MPVSTDQQDTTYLSEAVLAGTKAWHKADEGLLDELIRDVLLAAESHFQQHYEQKGAEGERERIRAELESRAEKEEQDAASYTGLPSQAGREDAEIARATYCEVLDFLAALSEKETDHA